MSLRTEVVISIVAIIISIISLVVSAVLIIQGHEFDREKQAVSYYRDYLKDQRERSKIPIKDTQENRLIQSLPIVYAEAIFDSVGENEAWKETVKEMLLNEQKVSGEVQLNCSNFDPAFVDFAKSTLEGQVCSE